MSQTPDNLPHTRVLGYLTPRPKFTTVRRIARITMWIHALLLTLAVAALGAWTPIDLYRAYQDVLRTLIRMQPLRRHQRTYFQTPHLTPRPPLPRTRPPH